MKKSSEIKLHGIRAEILRVLEKQGSTYAYPVKSQDIGQALNVSPSYVREVLGELQQGDLVRARRGRGGGYYLAKRG